MQNEITILKAIQTLEKICLSSDSNRTTKAEIKENGWEETVKYYNWLRRQCPMSSLSLPLF